MEKIIGSCFLKGTQSPRGYRYGGASTTFPVASTAAGTTASSVEENLLGDEGINFDGEGTVETSQGEYAPSVSETLSASVDQKDSFFGLVSNKKPRLEHRAQL